MSNKTINARALKQKSMQAQNVKQKKTVNKTRNEYALINRSLSGNAFNLGGEALKLIGSGIGAIFGAGDYTVTGPRPSYNVFAGQIPKFSTTRATNIVTHREYIGDISGTSAFTSRTFPLNPGLPSTFPWLSQVASGYAEYKFHGIIFEFRSMITDFVTSGAPGVVMMATNYNADAPNYSTKQEMENSEYAVSTKPTLSQVHMVECAGSQTPYRLLYTRSGVVPAEEDLRLYDHGNFILATQANPVQLLGELWVSYCVEFFKPILSVGPVGAFPQVHMLRQTVSSAAPLGTANIRQSGSLFANVDVAGTTIIFTDYPDKVDTWLITVTWTGTAVANTIPPGVTTLTNCTAQAFWANGARTEVGMPSAAVAAVNTVIGHSVTVRATDRTAAFSYAYNGAGVYPTNAVVDIFILPLEDGITQ